MSRTWSMPLLLHLAFSAWLFSFGTLAADIIPTPASPSPTVLRCDFAVIGRGSGRFGAALAASRMGVDVVLVEKADCLGGNSVRGGVNIWEPGLGGPGIPFEPYQRLKLSDGRTLIADYFVDATGDANHDAAWPGCWHRCRAGRGTETRFAGSAIRAPARCVACESSMFSCNIRCRRNWASI
jgi:hypothetical protein